MGREIRMVPPNWDHPITEDTYGRMRAQPMFDSTYEEASKTWLADFDRIRAGKMSDFEAECYPRGICDWACENPSPDPRYYRPWSEDEATWFQVWETVSEGTPVTPPFETREELVDYLEKNGDFWDQKRCHEPNWVTLYKGTPGVSGWGREPAERFVMGPGCSPTLVIADGKPMRGTEALAHISRPAE